MATVPHIHFIHSCVFSAGGRAVGGHGGFVNAFAIENDGEALKRANRQLSLVSLNVHRAVKRIEFCRRWQRVIAIG